MSGETDPKITKVAIDSANIARWKEIFAKIQQSEKVEEEKAPLAAAMTEPAPSVEDEAKELQKSKAIAESEALASELKSKLQAFNNGVARLQDIHKARLIGLVCLFALVVLWLIAILFFVALSGITLLWWDYGKILKLSDPVILALIGSTTLNVLGLFTVAAKWLYGEQKRSGSKDSEEG